MNKKGFTLIEVIIIILLIAVITLILVPTFNKSIENGRKKSYIESLHGLIRALEIYTIDNPNVDYSNFITISSVVDELEGVNFNTITSGEFRIYGDTIVLKNVTNNRYCLKNEVSKNDLAISKLVKGNCS